MNFSWTIRGISAIKNDMRLFKKKKKSLIHLDKNITADSTSKAQVYKIAGKKCLKKKKKKIVSVKLVEH